MRFLVISLSILVATLGLPSVQGHMADCKADTLCHMTLNVKDLGPGDEHRFLLHSERIGGDFPAGWIITAFAGVEGEGSLHANLTLDNATRHTWDWSGNQYSSNSTRVVEAGHYELRVHNPGPTSVRYAFYFDQSCNCAYKVIPINGGFVLFNYDLPAERGVRLGFPTIDGWHIRGHLAVLEDERGRWPEDFTVLETKEQKNKGWLQFDFRTQASETHYVFVEALEGVKQGPNGPIPVELTPLLEVEEAKSPSVAFIVMLGIIASLALLVRRRR